VKVIIDHVYTYNTILAEIKALQPRKRAVFDNFGSQNR
jgi:hypothetical protein